MSEHRGIVCLPAGAGGRTAALAGGDVLGALDVSGALGALGAAESDSSGWHEGEPGMWEP